MSSSLGNKDSVVLVRARLKLVCVASNYRLFAAKRALTEATQARYPSLDRTSSGHCTDLDLPFYF